MNLLRLKEYRLQQEEIVKAELMQLEAELHDLVGRTHSLADRVQRLVDEHRAAMDRGVLAVEVEAWYAEVVACEDQLRSAMATADATRLRWEVQREVVLEAGRERQKLERLEHRYALRRRLLLLRREQQAIDEAAQIRFLRSRRGDLHGDPG